MAFKIPKTGPENTNARERLVTRVFRVGIDGSNMASVFNSAAATATGPLRTINSDRLAAFPAIFRNRG
jgi:hypothetical protein